MGYTLVCLCYLVSRSQFLNHHSIFSFPHLHLLFFTRMINSVFHHGQNRGYAWATTPRFGKRFSGFVLFRSLYLRLHRSLAPRAKLWLCMVYRSTARDTQFYGSFFFLIFPSFLLSSHNLLPPSISEILRIVLTSHHNSKHQQICLIRNRHLCRISVNSVSLTGLPAG